MVYWIVATLCAYFVKGLCGFANTLVFTSILSFGVNNVDISPVDLLLGFPANVIVVFRERKAVKWSLCLPLAGLVILGCIPGALFLKNVDVKLIKIFFGAVIIFVGVEMLLREMRAKKTKPSRAMMLFIGVLSGVLCGLYGVGALVGAYISRMTDDSHAFKGNISMVFFCENVFRIILYIASGVMTMTAFLSALKLLPVELAGLALGMLAGKVMDERKAKYAVVAALIVSGAALIVNSL